jgi:thiamine kinase-like enzyme
VGSALPWPAWTHTGRTLAEVARWLRRYHDVVADFIPPHEAVWRMGGQWRPALIIGHNDAAPYNAVWRAGQLAGFIDWDMAAPVTPAWDLAFAAFSWVPLHARHVVTREGFTSFSSRPARLRLFLAGYGWTGTTGEFIDVIRAHIRAHAAGVRALAATGDPLFTRLVVHGVADDLDTALIELEKDRSILTAA